MSEHVGKAKNAVDMIISDALADNAMFLNGDGDFVPASEVGDKIMSVLNANGYRQEHCICAAIKTTCDKIIRGHRHHDCISIIRASGIGEIGSEKGVQGFVTSTGRFVDRKEGYLLQAGAGIESIAKGGYRNKELFSEDLY